MGVIKEARYRETKTGQFYGIHLYGSSGQKAYTNSVLNILKGSQLAPADYDYYHQDCPQSRYQEKKPKKSYSQAARGRNNQNVHSQQRVLSQPNFTLPTANRFESLSGMRNQGNWY